jgi:hypothetical protein
VQLKTGHKAWRSQQKVGHSRALMGCRRSLIDVPPPLVLLMPLADSVPATAKGKDSCEPAGFGGESALSTELTAATETEPHRFEASQRVGSRIRNRAEPNPTYYERRVEVSSNGHEHNRTTHASEMGHCSARKAAKAYPRQFLSATAAADGTAAVGESAATANREALRSRLRGCGCVRL